MPLSPLNTNARVGDQAYDAIHTAIVNGEYEAGRRLQIRDLAADLGISVMPVREAIKRLEEVGLVETKPYRGAVVREFQLSELLSIYQVRRMLEVHAAEMGVQSVSGEQIEELESLYRQLVLSLEEGRLVDYLDLDEQILVGIYGAVGNPVLLDTIQRLWVQCRHFKIVGIRDEYSAGDPERLHQLQRMLIDAAVVGDSAAAARITDDSLDKAIDRIGDAIKSGAKRVDPVGEAPN